MPAGDATSLWEIGVSPRTGKVVAQLKRLTTGGGNETDASCAAGGTLAFASPSFVQNIWILPYNLDRGKASGEIRRITETPAARQYVSLSSDGRYLAFTSNQAGQDHIWMRDLETGKETRVTTSTFRQNWASISPTGTKVAYSSIEKDDRRLVYVTTPGGVPEKLCEGCLRATGWSHDEKAVVDFGGNPYHINLLDLASHKETLLVKPSTNSLLYARLSPNDRWISFTVRLAPNHGRIVVANITGPLPVPESLWSPIAEVDIDDWADWSPDGNTLYFSSAKDGYSCFWGQRLDPNSRRPIGEPFAVQHLHGSLSYGRRGWAAGGNRIAIVLSETHGNIWLMSRTDAR
jgi:eukaryotic-like serine/threonine-protein kinase